MITPDNLTDLLAVPGFQKAKTVWRKTIGAALLEHSIAKPKPSSLPHQPASRRSCGITYEATTMKLAQFKAGVWKKQYEYRSFAPVMVNQVWTWEDPTSNIPPG